YFDLGVSELLQGTDAKNSYVYCELLVGAQVASAHDYFFAPFKELRMPKPSIIFAVVPTRDGFKVTVSSDKFAKTVYLYASDQDGSFSDNYFDLIPARAITVEYQARAPLSLPDFRARRPPGFSTRTTSLSICWRSVRFFNSCNTKLESTT